MSVSRSISREPSGPFGLTVKVGSDISSATNGSSVSRVAGKKRCPTNPCDKAGVGRKDKGNAVHAAANAAKRLDVIVGGPSRRTGKCTGWLMEPGPARRYNDLKLGSAGRERWRGG